MAFKSPSQVGYRILAAAVFLALQLPVVLAASDPKAINVVCNAIRLIISSSSGVYFPGDTLYDKDVKHWAGSSSDQAACSVEPGSAADLSKIIRILGTTRTPFAVKGGGHTANPGFSSTKGVQIAMYRFSEVIYDAKSQTAEVGAGLIWDNVYTALEPHGVNVIGGRVTGVGVAGFILGGGYSWLSNQYGLAIDNIVAYELVLPSGTITTVTEASNPDLWFGLRGGLNKFGIVTKFTLKTHPQGQVWGGLINYLRSSYTVVSAAVEKFANENTDPKAAIITSYSSVAGLDGINHLLFYDGPKPPPGIFDDFLKIGSFTKDVRARSFVSLVQSSPANATAGFRGYFDTVTLAQYSHKMLQVIQNETLFYGKFNDLFEDSQVFISYDVEPFLPSLFTFGKDSLYPPDRATRVLSPLNIYFAWLEEEDDGKMLKRIKTTADTIRSEARKDPAQGVRVRGVQVGGGEGGQEILGVLGEGQKEIMMMEEDSDVGNAAKYPNYALFDTGLEMLYGANVERFKALKAVYDPLDVMGLAGGFR